jgi:hypothetical protein
MKYRTSVILTIVALFILCLYTSCYSLSFKDREFHIKDGTLYRGKDTYTLQAFYVPDAAQKGAELKAMVPLLASIAEVGGNAVAMDLFNDANTNTVDSKTIETIKTYADRAKDQYMTVVLRIAPNTKPSRKDPIFNALKQNFKGLLTIVYWTDGPHAEEWTKDIEEHP